MKEEMGEREVMGEKGSVVEALGARPTAAKNMNKNLEGKGKNVNKIPLCLKLSTSALKSGVQTFF